MGNNWRQWAFAVEDIKSTDKFVLVALGDLCHDLDDKGRPNDTCFPKLATLARMTGLNERTIGRATSRLETAGYVISFKRERRDGSQGSNTYRLVKHPAGRQLSLIDALQSDGGDTVPDPADFMPQAHPVTEAIPAVTKGTENPPDGTESPICPGGAPPHIGRSAAPMTNPLTTSEQKQDSAGVHPLVSFADFCEGFDERGLEERVKAEKVWNRMSGQRRVRAIKGIPGYTAMLKANPWRSCKSAWRWLSEGAFDDWQDAPAAKPEAKPVVLDPNHPYHAQRAAMLARVGPVEFSSWLAHLAIERDGERWILSAPTRFLRDWINNNYSQVIDAVIGDNWRMVVAEDERNEA